MSTLRQRNRERAMEQVFLTAFELFEKRGYDQVTIKDIANQAGVSESTFYRLFGTKEGLFTASPWEGPPQLEASSVGEAAVELRELLTAHTWRGIRWVMEQPDVRRAVLASLDEAAQTLAAHLSQRGVDPLSAAVDARALFFGAYLSSLERWHADGEKGDFAAYYDEGVRTLRLT